MSELAAGPGVDTGADWDSAPAPASRVRYRVLDFACALAVVTYIQRIGFSVGAPEIKRGLGLDDAQVGYLMSAFLVAYGCFQVPGGLLGDRLGGRHVLAVLVLVWSLLTAAVALAVLLPAIAALPFVFLLVNRFLFGMFQAGGFPTLGRVVADWMPVTERGFAQGAIWMFSRMGRRPDPVPAGLALRHLRELAGPVRADRRPGSRLVRRVLALVPQPARGDATGQPRRAEAHRGRPAARYRSSRDPVPWSRMLRSLSVWSLCLMYGFTGFSGNFFTNMLPLYLSEHRHLSPAGYDLAIGDAPGGRGRWPASWAAPRPTGRSAAGRIASGDAGSSG